MADQNGSKAAILLMTGISGMGGAIATGATLWGWVIRPYEERLSKVERELGETKSALASHERLAMHPGTNDALGALNKDFERVETQLGKASALLNNMVQDLYRDVIVLLKKVDGTDKPMPTYWPSFGNQE